MLLAGIARHLQPRGAVGMSGQGDTLIDRSDRPMRVSPWSGAPVVDHYGNSWAVDANGALVAQAAGSDETVGMGLPGGAAVHFVAIDDHGFIWTAGGSQIFFSNPRALVDTETPDGSPEQLKDDPLAFYAVDSSLLPGTAVMSLERSTETGSVIVTFSNCITLELDVIGSDAPTPGPYTCGHGGAVVRAPSSDNSAWRILPARLPCGNHDIYATEVGGRIFVTGGVTHHHGLPAVRHTFTELLVYDGEVWNTHAHMPEACCYSAMAGLDGDVYVVGGSTPAGTNCWIFSATTGERRDGPSLPSPRLGCIGAAINGRVYVVGGSGGFGGEALDEVLSIAPGDTEWRVETPAPGGPLPAATLAGCVLDGVIFVLGGAPARFMAYDVRSGKWDASLPPHPEGSQAAYMAAHDGAVWVACGGKIIGPTNPKNRGDGRQYSTAVWSYRPGASEWERQPEMRCWNCWGAAWSYRGDLLLIGGAHRDASAGAYLFDSRLFALCR